MPFNSSGVYVPVAGAVTAFPGQVIASATWNAIHTDMDSALTQLGQATLSVPRVVTTVGAVTVTATDTFIVINKAAPSVTPINLPTVASRNMSPLRIKDWAGNGGDITITPNGAETIEGLATWIVTSGGSAGTGGSITLMPVSALSGWAVVV